MSDRQLWDFLEERLNGCHGDVYVNDERTPAEIRADHNRFGRFDFLTNWDEMFNGYKAFLVCPPGQPVRVLCREFPASVGLSVGVSLNGVRQAAAAFVRWYDKQNEELSGRTG